VQHRSYLHTRVSGWVISSSPVKRFLNRCTSPHHTPEHTLKTLQFSQRETRERETRRGEEASEVQEREGRGERASVLRRWPQPPVIVASSTSFFLSRSRHTPKPRRRLPPTPIDTFHTPGDKSPDIQAERQTDHETDSSKLVGKRTTFCIAMLSRWVIANRQPISSSDAL
jgi:hypothetical protein